MYLLKGVNSKKQEEICRSPKMSQTQNSMIILIYFSDTPLVYIFNVFVWVYYFWLSCDGHATSDWYLQQVNIKANELCRIAKTLFKTSNLTHSSWLIMKLNWRRWKNANKNIVYHTSLNFISMFADQAYMYICIVN